MADQSKKARKAAGAAPGQAGKSVSDQAEKVDDATGTSGGQIGQSVRQLVGVASKRLASSVSGRVGQLTAYAERGGKPTAAAKEAAAEPAGQEASDQSEPGGNGDRLRVTIEQIDVGAATDLVYDEWTRFEDFPALWSHRSPESTVVEEVPNERMVWTSEGDHEHIDAAVTFHELAPDLTRVVLVLEYHPKNILERAGNLWRARASRARHDLRNFQRHVMTQAVLHSEEEEPAPERGRSRGGRGTAKNKPNSNRRSRT